MKNEFRREQHYAVSKDGTLVHIKDVHNNSEYYYCPHCGCRMLKRCGNIRAWHFAHDWRYANEFQKNCSYETYLHGYAKLRLKQWFEESDSIILHYIQSIVCMRYNSCKLVRNNSCCKSIEKFCDIKKLFNHCLIESSVKESNGNYRADLLLYSDLNPSRHILIEIKVSHGCTEKKKASNAQIIEFDVKSEEDIEYIVSHDIEESDKVRYYGFKNLIKQDNTGLIEPTQSVQKFILYKSGKTFCKTTDCQSITIHHHSALFELTTSIFKDDYWHLNIYGLMKAREQGFRFPNCYLCEHRCYKKDNNCFMCKINNEIIEKGSDALKCKYYIFKSSAFEKINSFPFEVCDTWNYKV